MTEKEQGENLDYTVPLCKECGIYPSDEPGKLCAGCDSYQDHF